ATFFASSNGQALGVPGTSLRSVSDMAGSYGPGRVRSITTTMVLSRFVAVDRNSCTPDHPGQEQ
ncbi:MAG: hypothetical protein ACJ8AW_09895, partial [Rhodopila sp.]